MPQNSQLVELRTVVSALESLEHVETCLVAIMRLHGAIPPTLEVSSVYLALLKEQLEQHATEQGLEL